MIFHDIFFSVFRLLPKVSDSIRYYLYQRQSHWMGYNFKFLFYFSEQFLSFFFSFGYCCCCCCCDCSATNMEHIQIIWFLPSFHIFISFSVSPIFKFHSQTNTVFDLIITMMNWEMRVDKNVIYIIFFFSFFPLSLFWLSLFYPFTGNECGWWRNEKKNAQINLIDVMIKLMSVSGIFFIFKVLCVCRFGCRFWALMEHTKNVNAL